MIFSPSPPNPSFQPLLPMAHANDSIFTKGKEPSGRLPEQGPLQLPHIMWYFSTQGCPPLISEGSGVSGVVLSQGKSGVCSDTMVTLRQAHSANVTRIRNALPDFRLHAISRLNFSTSSGNV